MRPWWRFGASVAAWAIGCGCPRPVCADTAYVDLIRRAPWQAGAWRVRLTAEGLSLDCSVGVPRDGWAPTLLDLSCGDRVDRTAFVADTGLWDGAKRLRLRTTVSRGEAAPPPQARLEIMYAPFGGPRQVVRDEIVALSWRPPFAVAEGCEARCEVTELDVDVPVAQEEE